MVGTVRWVVMLASLTSEPTMTTGAGTGRAGDSARGLGGRAVEAQLRMPFDVAFDSAGNLYLSDTFNHRKVAQLRMPFDVAFDSAGNLYLSDTFNHRVRKIDRATGAIATVAGNGHAGFAGDAGPAAQCQLNEPYGIVLDPSGNSSSSRIVLIRRVRRVDASGPA